MPATRYADSGELSIAYQVVGEGPSDVIFIPGFISHADLQWQMPLFGHVLRHISEFSRLVVFDKRGTGQSERTLGFGTVEERMDDIRAVAEAAGVEQATVIGISEGGPLALVYAATYPERVRSVVLWGTYARIMQADDYPIGIDEFLADSFSAAIRDVWGTGHALEHFVHYLPEVIDRDRIAQYERSAATPRQVGTILHHNSRIDVRPVLPSINVPALVIHRTGDPLVPVEHGRYLAEHIDGATLVELPGTWHLNAHGYPEDTALDAIEEFVTGERQSRVGADRFLATVLFTDICNSTARAVELGDQRWKELLARHDEATVDEVERHRGRVVKTTGDGALATFDGPARAVHCARAIQERVRTIGVDIRAGLHAGEVERQGDDVAGVGVHIGARVGALAGPGEILTSQTVKDLVLGSGLEFESRGSQQLKGVPGEWQLYAVRG